MTERALTAREKLQDISEAVIGGEVGGDGRGRRRISPALNLDNRSGGPHFFTPGTPLELHWLSRSFFDRFLDEFCLIFEQILDNFGNQNRSKNEVCLQLRFFIEFC